jgi:hypothetical protein
LFEENVIYISILISIRKATFYLDFGLDGWPNPTQKIKFFLFLTTNVDWKFKKARNSMKFNHAQSQKSNFVGFLIYVQLKIHDCLDF